MPISSHSQAPTGFSMGSNGEIGCMVGARRIQDIEDIEDIGYRI
jgi:hypothetical protein